MTSIRACGLTDTGLAREHNEDCFAIDAENHLYVVADGMGGHSYGEVASRISVDSICAFVSRERERSQPELSPQELSPQGETRRTAEYDDRLQPHSNLLKAALLAAQEQVLSAIEEDLSLRGMGTTVVGLHLCDGIAAVAHVGDSRIYRVRRGEIEQLSDDHTWVNEQVIAGYLSAEQARTHPLRNVVTRALGGESEVAIDMQEVAVQEADLFLLCSDGLTGMLRDEEISVLLRDEPPLEEACQSLIKAANERGGADNITVVLVSIASGPS